MNDIPRAKLSEIIARYGKSICGDPKRCKALLNDFCPENRREVNLLVATIEEGIVESLMRPIATVPTQLLTRRLANRLHDNRGIAENFALWAVESWLWALQRMDPNGDPAEWDFTCPTCGYSRDIDGGLPKYAGNVIRCSKCKQLIRVSNKGDMELSPSITKLHPSLPTPGSFDHPAWDLPVVVGELLRFEGQVERVYSVAVAPDGRHVLSGDSDGHVKLWDLETGEEMRRFKGHTSSVDSVAFANDGGRAVSGSTDGSVRLWGMTTGLELRNYAVPAGYVHRVAFSATGNPLSWRTDGTLQMWDSFSGGDISRRKLHRMFSLAISPDGHHILSGTTDNGITLWNFDNGHISKCIGNGMGDVFSVAFSPDGCQALSGYNSILRLWDLETGYNIQWFRGGFGAVHSVSFVQNGRLAVSGHQDGTIYLWDLKSGVELRRFEGHTGDVYSLSVLPDSTRVVSGGKDGTIRVWGLP